MQRTAETAAPFAANPETPARYQPPRFEVISLDCEITSYAPDDRPLF